MKLDNIHVWTAQVPDEISAVEQVVAPVELAQAERFVFERDRRRYLSTRFMTRILLSRYLQEDPASLRFRTNEFGKPFLDMVPDSDVYFNLSHTQRHIVCAIANFSTIGIDIEDRVPSDFRELAEQFFAQEEIDWLSQETDDNVAMQRFLYLWTHKEAFIKAIGKGLSIPLKKFSVSPDSKGYSIVDDPLGRFSEIQRWRFSTFDYQCVTGAVCCPTQKCQEISLLEFRDWN